MSAARVDVVVPVISPTFLHDTLASLSLQDYDSWEGVVVSDSRADHDRVARVVAEFPRVRHVRSSAPSGGAATRNVGVLSSTAEVIAFLDSDDQWQPDYLGSQVATLDSAPTEVVCGDAVYMDATGRETGGSTYLERSGAEEPFTIQSFLRQSSNVCTSAVVMKRDAFVSAGMMDPGIRRGHDFELWLRMLARGYRFRYNHHARARYRQNPAGLTGSAISGATREVHLLKRAAMAGYLTADQRTFALQQYHRTRARLFTEYAKRYLSAGDRRRTRQALAIALRLDARAPKNWAALLLHLAAPSVLERKLGRGPA